MFATTPYSAAPIALFVFLHLQARPIAAHILPRQRGGGGDSDSDSDSDSDTDSESCKGNVCTVCQRNVCTTTTKGQPGPTSAPSANPTNSSVSGQQQQTTANGQNTANGAAGSGTATGTNAHNTRSTSGISADPSIAAGAAPVNNHSSANGGMSKGAIAGLVIGMVILAGLLFMIVAKYRKRVRRAKKQPRGFVPATFLTGSGSSTRGQNDMSQLPSSPMLSPRSPSANGQVSPLLPAVTPGYDDRDRGRGITSYPSSPTAPSFNQAVGGNRSLGRNGMGEDAESMLTSPYSDVNRTNAPLPPLPSHGSGTVTESGTLNSLRSYQKALEVDHDKRASQGRPSHDLLSDPPPSYS